MRITQNYKSNVTVATKVTMLCNFSIMLYACTTGFSFCLQLQIPLANFSQISEWQKFKDKEFIQILWQEVAGEKGRKECNVSYHVCGNSKSAQIHRKPNLTDPTVQGAAYTLSSYLHSRKTCRSIRTRITLIKASRM